MADEENKNLEESEKTAEETPAVENAADDSSSSAAGPPAGEESSAAAVDAGDDSEDSAPAAVKEEKEEDSEPVERLAPKERRKRNKSGKNRRPKYTGTLEERRAQRDVYRKKKAVQRRAHRLKQREEHKASGPRAATPPTVKEPGQKKFQQGTVVSNKTDKTIIVAIDMMESHRKYKKIVRHTKKLVAHDATNDANEGDTVRVIESRPLSRTKRWRLVEVIERAK